MTVTNYVNTLAAGRANEAGSPKPQPIDTARGMASGTADDTAGGAGLLPVGNPDLPPGGDVLTVGVGKQFATLAAAIAAAHDGTTILIDAGTYTNDFATITTKISIIGVGGMVNLVATIPPPNLKGILTVDNDVTIKNLSFSGCAIPDSDGGNGAGIRYEGGQMVLINDSFSGNQNGILANAVLPQLGVNTIAIDHCVFSGNGSGTGYTHNLYVGAVDRLTATNSVFEGALVGHEFKSRALVNDIEGNVFRDGPDGTASYDIDLPNGGVCLIRDNIIEKGPNAENNAMVHFGGEGIPYAGSSLTIEDNRFVNDKGGATVAVLNQTALSATIDDNVFDSVAAGQIVQGPASGTGNVDGEGDKLPDINLVGVLPGNTLIFTDDDPHSVVLQGTLQAVQGGGGKLTVTAPAGHIVAIGGAGGMDFSEGPASGGNSITTKAGSVNTIRVVGQDVIDSEGSDRIVGGAGNLTGLIGGTAKIDDGTGNDNWSVNGTARIAGHGGNPVVAVGPQGWLSVTGPLGYLAVQNNGGFAQFDIVQGGAAEAMSISGGAVSVRVYDATMNVSTASGPHGATLRLGAGAALITSLGADTIWAGSGSATIIVSGQATIHAGTGALSLFARSNSLGAVFYGNGGDYLLGGDTGNITYVGGAKASTIELKLSNNTLIGGDGHLTINGGSRETITGGAGGLTYTATNGGNTITTQAGSQNTLLLTGAETLFSYGSDTIDGGDGNQTMTIYGDATIAGSSGNSALSFYGTSTLIGQGQDWCSVAAGATLTVQAGLLTTVSETGGTVNFSVNFSVPGSSVSGSTFANVSVRGGGATIQGGANTPLTIDTVAGMATRMSLGRGTIAVSANGGDFIHAGSGADTITITAANAHVWGSSGDLVVHNYDWTAGDHQTVHGGSGTLQYDQGPGALWFIGGAGAATLDAGWGSLTAIAGAGDLAITGGSAGMRFIGGSGHADIAMTPGGGDVTFGSGTTSVQVASWGEAELFRCIAGQGGGTADITGFRSGVDRLILGVAIASEQVANGSTSLVLADNTRLNLIGLSDPSHLFG